MYTLNGWWFLSSSGSYPPVFTVLFVCTTLVLFVCTTLVVFVCTTVQ